jgi:Na+/phosphate symporter
MRSDLERICDILEAIEQIEKKSSNGKDTSDRYIDPSPRIKE